MIKDFTADTLSDTRLRGRAEGVVLKFPNFQIDYPLVTGENFW